jgi:hypothetical protein
VTGGARIVGWDPAAPAGYPTTVAATGVTFAAPPSLTTAKGVVFVDDTRVPASIFVTNPGDPAPPADADGYPTVLSAGEHVRQ